MLGEGREGGLTFILSYSNSAVYRSSDLVQSSHTELLQNSSATGECLIVLLHFLEVWGSILFQNT
jgi:hypothetical protein